ncbi:class I SAM-dependent methyltransferase [Uliginosibacterium sp. H3]|uniref:Class I SAM-dependent methyltransferase n=1 Tax=Uliginosibacterium silvisoli TaxID=3114758 RepID=A0ABU6K7M4_9RHOO|nr:class I SAM-dependent methyltransferase [Uliginosibacterium sp. H3]
MRPQLLARSKHGTIAHLLLPSLPAMNNWTDGYVTELPYSVNHFPEMAPAHLNLALLQLGLASPAITQEFNYLELGFGQGLGLNMLAATHPQGRFFGNDFMAAHVRAAQNLATQAGLDNLQLFEDSFAQLLERDLPPMDYIVLHGVYTWVNAENRAIIVALLHKLLKRGGVVYISYNCLPGWSVKAPLQRLMSEFAERKATGSALERFHTARDFLGLVDAADAAFFTRNPPARAMLAELEKASDAYLLHEFAPKGWTPFYHTDVAQDLAAADLIYAGSAKLFSNFPAYSLPPKMHALMDATADVGLRETLRDFAVQTPFRRDIFVRDARPLYDEEIDAHMRGLRLALLRPPASCSLRCQIPVGELQLDEETFGPLLQSLAQGPQEIRALMQLPVFAAAGEERCIDALNVLLCLDYVGIAAAQEATSMARVHALNRALLERLRSGERISGLASAALSTGITISYHDLLFLCAQQAGCERDEDIAAFAQAILSDDGTQDEGELAARRREASDFLRYGADFYRALDLF